MKSVAVILVAGGRGNRVGGSFPKQFIELKGRPVLMHTIDRFAEALPKSNIIVALHKDYVDYWGELCLKYEFSTRHVVCFGGETRFHTVESALKLIDKAEIVAIHDGVRPLVERELIMRAVKDAKAYGAVIPVIKPLDSLRELTEEGNEAVDREQFRSVQTPQVFRASVIEEAYNQGYRECFTDDASVVEAVGGKIFLCEGSYSNIKITVPEDFLIAEALIGREERIAKIKE